MLVYLVSIPSSCPDASFLPTWSLVGSRDGSRHFEFIQKSTWEAWIDFPVPGFHLPQAQPRQAFWVRVNQQKGYFISPPLKQDKNKEIYFCVRSRSSSPRLGRPQGFGPGDIIVAGQGSMGDLRDRVIVCLPVCGLSPFFWKASRIQLWRLHPSDLIQSDHSPKATASKHYNYVCPS